MAKIVGGVPPFIGTRDNLTIYLMNGEYIIRTKSSLTGKRVKRDPAFAKTMKYAGWLKEGARIASGIYGQLRADERVYKQYRELTGKAMSLLKEGFDAADVITMLEAVYLPQSVANVVSVSTGECREYCSESVDENCSKNCSKNYSKNYSRNCSAKSSRSGNTNGNGNSSIDNNAGSNNNANSNGGECSSMYCLKQPFILSYAAPIPILFYFDLCIEVSSPKIIKA